MNQNREFIYKRIGAKVAYFRISNGLTQEEMAARVHLSRSTLSKIEHGNYNRSISLDLLMAWALIFPCCLCLTARKRSIGNPLRAVN